MVESHKAAILAALRIAGELFEARDEAARLAAQMRELSDEIRPWLPPAKRHELIYRQDTRRLFGAIRGRLWRCRGPT